jgi:putative transposase
LFVSDTLSSGRTFRCLAVIDEFSRECLALHVAHSIPAVRGIDVLEQLRDTRGLPERITCDDGSAFTSRAFDAWACSRDIQIADIQPGKPVQNCFVESFLGSFSDECLNLHWFLAPRETRMEIDRWRRDYNRVRPHSSLGDLPPVEFALNNTTGFRE